MKQQIKEYKNKQEKSTTHNISNQAQNSGTEKKI